MECKLHAIHDHMPGPEGSMMLRVGGTCEAPNPGYKLSLKWGNPGINPHPDYVYLQLVVDDSKSEPPDVMTTTEVEELVERYDAEKKTVIVRGAEPETITIEHVD